MSRVGSVDNHLILYNSVVCTEQLNIVECEVEHGIYTLYTMASLVGLCNSRVRFVHEAY